MKIELKIDYDGKPYIELLSGREDTMDDLLQLFIREALEKGIYIKNEADMDTRDDYASIRINDNANRRDRKVVSNLWRPNSGRRTERQSGHSQQSKEPCAQSHGNGQAAD